MQEEIATLSTLLDQYADDPDFVSAFARGLAIFQILSSSRKPLTISDISKITKFPRATVRRALYTLIQLGYVSQEERYYTLTSKILMLSHSFITSQPLPNAAQPILENITKEVDEASSMAVLTQNQIIYIARSSENTQRIMSNTLAIGSQLPAYCTSMGRVLLAALPKEKQREIILESKPKAYTENTIYTDVGLLQELEKVQKQGYAIIDQELEIGLCSIAVPVFDKSGKVIAAINISTHALRTSIDEMLDNFLPILQRSASLLKTFL
ncbi:helix-turn-helix domain-containing protein [Ignatzschineria rhizosphaerae]|uniref:Helix-turn-helix domain-containing protein n=1 Tax=Ignatzschineria rhizosphaerae TaxID=2923279 RepID=A0ABY3X0I9_9GAMM|nr:IclR family transcriptional regulator C-terminal domain-containing protein [Ignatzschineria rhizosphaerae]UNM96386.1 helix-turn-helix domain-containing protein [Ignatzschineria rhizosphaerae]